MRWLWVAAAAAMAAMGQTVPLRVEGTVATVEATVNGKGPFVFVIDTGAESCSLLPEVWQAVGARAEYRVELLSSAGVPELVPASGSLRFGVGAAGASGVETLVHDLPAVRAAVPRASGVLGQSFLARFDYVLDYASGRLAFGGTLPGVRLPLRRVGGLMVVRAAVDGRQVHLVLDSGASHLILRSAAALPEGNGFLAGNAGVRPVTRGKVGRLTIGGAVLRNIQTAWLGPDGNSPADGLLPASLFRRIYVNCASGFTVMEQ